MVHNRVARWMQLLLLFALWVVPASLPCLGPTIEIAEARSRSGSVSVRGYYRKDGTYVRPHYRSAPDGNFNNNWSTKGNVNPYTGAPGTKVSPPSTYGQDVHVEGYTRSDGAYVPPHYRSAPDGNPSNNWSSVGNTNPYTGDEGKKRPEYHGQVAPPAIRLAPRPRASISALQTALLFSGHDPGPLDGIAGPKTKRALGHYIRAEGLRGTTLPAVLTKLAGQTRRYSPETATELERVAASVAASGR